MLTNQQILKNINNGLIISCQVKKDDPQYQPGCIVALAKAAVWGQADGLRINEPENIREVKQAFPEVCVIGLWKKPRQDTEVFMTPTMAEVKACFEAGADIIAIDGTPRLIDCHQAWDIIPLIKKEYPGKLIFADVRDDVDAQGAISRGADFVAPTFYRFSANAKSTDLPDWPMVCRMVKAAQGRAKVVMEGKIWTPDDAIRALHYGCYAVVVGSAITRPHLVTRRFHDHICGFAEERSLFY